MKYLLITIAILLSTLFAFANKAFVYDKSVADTIKTKADTLTEPDTTIINFSNKKILIIKYHTTTKTGEDDSERDTIKHPDTNIDEVNGCKFEKNGKRKHSHLTKKFNAHFASIDFGLNNYLTHSKTLILDNSDSYMELDDSKSYAFAVNFINFSIPIYRDKIGIVSGLGLKWNNYKFDDKSFILMNDSSKLYAIKDTVSNYSTNKLTASYLILPLMLEIHPLHNSEKLWLLVGAYGGVKIGSHSKLKTTSGDKTKVKKDFHLNTLIYGLRTQVGSGNWGLFCNYSLSTLFKKGEGPELYPLSLGLALVF